MRLIITQPSSEGAAGRWRPHNRGSEGGQAEEPITADPQRSLATFADRLNFLFETVHPATRGPYSNDQVAETISTQQATKISAAYIWLLRTGRRDNPTIKHVEALARFFGVPPGYFFNEDTAGQVAQELRLVQALKTVGVQKLALRATGLSTRSIDSLLEVINRVRELEGLSKQSDEQVDFDTTPNDRTS